MMMIAAKISNRAIDSPQPAVPPRPDETTRSRKIRFPRLAEPRTSKRKK